MAWETREGRWHYYARSRKVGGRVIREYLGGGHKGELAAAQDVRRRADQRAQDEALRADQARWQSVEGLLEEIEDLTRVLTHAVLYTAGYHQHAGGHWRRWHGLV
jgi:hypothetical protein